MAVNLYISITENSQNITNNTSNATVTLSVTWTWGSYNQLQKPGWVKIDGTTYSFTSSFNYDATTTGSQVIYSKTVDVAHNSNGSKTLNVSASYSTNVSSGTITASDSLVLTTIPRKSTLSVSNGTLDTAQTLTVTRKSTDFTHTIKATCGSASTTICSKSSNTSISFTPPVSWASQNTTGTSVSVKYTITTYNGSTSIGTNTYTKTCSIPSSVKPSCSIAVSDSKGYLNTYGGYIKGKSKFKVVVTGTTSHGSTISAYSTTANGSTYTASSFTTEVIKTSGTLTIKSKVTDKRGRTGTASTNVTVLAYADPTVTLLKVTRCNSNGTSNDQGEYVKVTFSATVKSLSSKNSATYKLKYKKTSDESYTTKTLSDYTGTYSVSEGTYIFAANSSSSYNVAITVTDNFVTVTKRTTASTGFTLLNFLKSGTGLAIGKVAEIAKAFDVGVVSYFRKAIILDNDVGLKGRTADGSDIRSIAYVSTNNNVVLGYGSYANESGYTNLYGNMLKFYVKSADSSYVPYYMGGDSISLRWRGAGMMTDSSKSIYFTIMLNRPVLGVSDVIVTSHNGIIVRQEGKYLFGSSSNTYAIPASYTANLGGDSNVLRISATFDNTTNVVYNNGPVCIDAYIDITFWGLSEEVIVQS